MFEPILFMPIAFLSIHIFQTKKNIIINIIIIITIRITSQNETITQRQKRKKYRVVMHVDP